MPVICISTIFSIKIAWRQTQACTVSSTSLRISLFRGCSVYALQHCAIIEKSPPSALCSSPDFKGVKPQSHCQKWMQELHWTQVLQHRKHFQSSYIAGVTPESFFSPLRYSQLASGRILTWCQSRLEKLFSSLWSYLASSFLKVMWGISLRPYLLVLFSPPLSYQLSHIYHIFASLFENCY